VDPTHKDPQRGSPDAIRFSQVPPAAADAVADRFRRDPALGSGRLSLASAASRRAASEAERGGTGERLQAAQTDPQLELCQGDLLVSGWVLDAAEPKQAVMMLSKGRGDETTRQLHPEIRRP